MANTRMKIMRCIAAVIALLLGTALTGFAETVTNVRGLQRPNSNLVDIYYDLESTDGGTYTVEVAIEGRADEVAASTLSGDVGDGVEPGKNLHIVWDAGTDWPNKKGDVKAAITTTRSVSCNKVQLWEGGPYWADRNIGASAPEDYGLYFWWGDTTGHRPSGGTFSFTFTRSNCPTYYKTTDQLRSEGWITSNGVLAPSHDAAYVKWGGNWRMPTYRELNDLNDKCDWTWTTKNGVNGYIVRGRGGYASNIIFLPSAGRAGDFRSSDPPCDGSGASLIYAGSCGRYWSSVPDSDFNYFSCYLRFDSVDNDMRDSGNRSYGYSIRPVQGFAAAETTTGSSEWFLVDTTDSTKVLVHFDANGGVFRRSDGTTTNKFDQYFTYGEPQRLFTDTLTPLKPDENGNQFVGWVRESPEVTTGSSIVDAREERTWYEHDGVTEVTYYAVWTTTVNVLFYNDTDIDSGNRILSPDSLGNHLSWSVDDDIRRFKGGESVQVLPGQRIIRLYVDDDYHWIAGRFDLGIDEPHFNRAYNYLELNIENDFRDALVYGSTPREWRNNIYVKVEPDINQPDTHGDVVFFYSAAVREELRSLINVQRGNVPAFDMSKVRISIGKTVVNQSGIVEWDAAHGLNGLELHKYYCLPTGLYYLKNVVYDADIGSGDPYWGALLDSTFKNQLIEVKDCKTTERTIYFDVFGGADVTRAVFDSRRGECQKSEAWFPLLSTQHGPNGIRVNSDKALPTPKRSSGFNFLGWFTEKEGGKQLKQGALIPSDKVHWTFEDFYTFTAYAQWTNMTPEYFAAHHNLVTASGNNLVAAASMTAANGCRTVAECYALGIDPEDPNDDLKITDFKMEGGKPVITLNHTEDGSGNSFLPRVKTLGKAALSDAEEWREVPEDGDPSMHFFKVNVEMP